MARIRSKEAMRMALVELLLEKPLDKITVTEVVARAGVSRVTYYRAYYSLQEVIDEALDEIFLKVEGYVSTSTTGSVPVSKRIFELSTYQALVLYRENKDLLCRLLLGHLSSEVINRMYELAFRLIVVGPTLGRGVSEAPNLTEGRIATMKHAYIAGGMTTVIVDWLRGGCEVPVEDVLEFVLSVSPWTYERV